jgi:hypothetical protein
MEKNGDTPLPWEEAWLHDAFTRAAKFQSFPGGPIGYRLRRIILTNFWLYEHQVFEIAHGRLGLTGENTTGKTTVLIAAMLALDGDHRPVRLDTLGGAEKRLEYYIIGGQDSRVKFERKQCTSYIALEFEWCDPEHPPFAPELRLAWEQGKREQARFLTIGLVFSGRKEAENPATLRYRFAILDSSRLDRDRNTQLATTYTSKGQRYAHDPDSFREQLTGHGKIFRKPQEYEEFVSQALFGFSDVRHFQQLIDLLMKIRNPKLQLTVPALREYLSQALPGIPEQVMQQTASTLERMNGLREDLDSLHEAHDAARKLYEQQELVAQLEGQLIANEYLYAYEQEIKADEEAQHQKQKLQEAINTRKLAEERFQEIQNELQAIRSKLQALAAKDEFQIVQQLELEKMW